MEDQTKQPAKPVQPAAGKEEEKDSKRRGLIIIIILQSVAIAVMGWFGWNQTEKIKTEYQEKIIYIEKSNGLQSELSTLKEEFQTLETKDAAVQKQLNERIAQIEEMEKEAAKHKNDANVIAKLRRETETLRKIMKGFVHTIDSLNTLNQTVTAEKNKVQGELTAEKGRSEQLSKEKKDLEGVVATGSMLKTQGVSVLGIHLKSGGKKESETKKAKKTDRIKVSFAIAENAIAKKGMKDLFIRVLTPDGKEMSKNAGESEMFSLPNGTKTFYAGKYSVSYDNREVKVNIACESKTGFIPGKYMVFIYNEGAEIGQSSIVLE